MLKEKIKEILLKISSFPFQDSDVDEFTNQILSAMEEEGGVMVLPHPKDMANKVIEATLLKSPIEKQVLDEIKRFNKDNYTRNEDIFVIEKWQKRLKFK